ncbi:carbamoyltransferase HypF [Actinopolymorpha pittospori]
MAGPVPESQISTRQGQRVVLDGTVLGVGLRPYVQRLASKLGLDGTARAVRGRLVIEVAGPPETLTSFVREICDHAPPPATVREAVVVDLEGVVPSAGTGFHMVRTVVAEQSGALASEPDGLHPDLPTCAECMRELFDPADRRYRYPFLSCAACGPRSSIIDELPLDRARTAMAGFAMCAACEEEYADPRSRRFRAPAQACPTCGPRLWWRAASDQGPVRRDVREDVREEDDALTAAVELIAAGGILAVKSVGGYQLMCDATEPRTVARLRARKRRWTSAFPLMVADVDVARSIARISFAEEQLLTSAQRPTVLAPLRRTRLPIAGAGAGSDQIGLSLAPTPLHALLLHELDRPVVVTSGNQAEQPMVIADEEEAMERLAGLADGFLLHDQPIRARGEESLCWVVAGRPSVLRRGRGLAQGALRLPVPARRPILAAGAQLAHTFALAAAERIVVSAHVGDLANTTRLEVFERDLAQLSSLTGITPEVVAHDLHPGYLASQYAGRWPASGRIAVQHHHAHVAACAAEHQVTRPFLGIAYDGLGIGDDGTFWGGEVLLADLRTYRRVGRFGMAPLPGGEAAIRRPVHMALGYLLGGERLGGAPIEPELIRAYTERLPDREIETVRRMVRGGVNSPVASSAARLMDAVASLLRLREDAAYEGAAATVLEAAARERREEELPWRVVTNDGVRVYDPTSTLAAVLAGVADGVPVGRLAAAFHATLTAVTLALCVDTGRESGVDVVCLSGSVFQNRLLTTSVVDALRLEGFEVFVPEQLPTNDGGVSFGQAAVAAARMATS